ncbi:MULTISPECIES: N-acetylmuramoyl-L-alanine amidase family protein [unclassified Bacillus (in: firmicutes)]|uniref:N-acetylmuramoyl-L-alanine amidase family protein n=1 Tax=unclassified Bacillus (in: firmicutes) TaxID=185979 RepID=UPI0008EA1C1E|nr:MULTISPECIES: Ig-like domain-containing protein [unclassified Bacillus (in: firmicutes)]SFB04595.1 Putative cell wall binding repeat-containing protein [Bacillus sp. UNCCL13]SFQ88474.1 Putative cell wall binding repeat-containing protein [Bacillus sp. cl95]
MRQILQKLFIPAMMLTFLALFAYPQTEARAEGTTVQNSIMTDTVWTKANSPYKVDSPIYITSNATLTIEPGVKVIGSSATSGGTMLIIQGKLKAVGTTQDPIELMDIYLNADEFQATSVNIENAKVTKTHDGGFLMTTSGKELILKNSEFSNGDIHFSSPDVPHYIENNLFRATAPVTIDGGSAPALFKRNAFFNNEDTEPAIKVNCDTYECIGGNITITENNFFGQISQPHVFLSGSKTFSFDAKNNYWGSTVEKTINVRIKTDTNTLDYKPYATMPFVNGQPYGELEPPAVNFVTDAAENVSGQTDANTTVKVSVNGTVIGSGVSDETGNYQVHIDKQKAGTILSLSATDSLKRVSSSTITNVIDGTAPVAPTVKPVYTNATTITGTTEPLASIIVKVDGIQLPKVYADDKGKFSVNVNPLVNGKIVEVQSWDTAYNRSTWTTLTVSDAPLDTVPPEVWVELLYDYSTEIRGTTEPGAEITIYNGEQLLGTTTADENGIYTLKIDPQTGGSILTITAKDAAGNEAPTPITTKVFTTKQRWITVNEITTNSKTITGKVQYPNAYITVKINGQIIEGRAAADGTFSITIPAQPENTQIWIHALNPAGDSSDSVMMQVKWAPPNGWYTRDGYKYYFDSVTGKHKTGWFSYNSKWYYFAADGKMQIGWKLISNKWYFLQADGVMKTGWLSYNGKWYYFPSSGAMQTGWLTLGTKKYYFATSGIMQIGWVKIGTSWYYFTTSGSMQTGWLKLGSYWYYFNTNGVMQTGTITISGKRYTFNSKGVWIK